MPPAMADSVVIMKTTNDKTIFFISLNKFFIKSGAKVVLLHKMAAKVQLILTLIN
jgi:hypothetical protein